MFDWGEGDYSRTAAQLAPAAEALVEAVGARVGVRLLDLACGTGNAALAAAARGAEATGVDASAALVAQARERAAASGLDARFLVGDLTSLPVPDGAADATVSCFGAIFAPDPARAAAEMVRVTAPGGALALTSWMPEGAIHRSGRLVQEALPPREGPEPRWGDAAWVEALLEAAGAEGARVAARSLEFRASSPEAWFADQEEHHPFWRWARGTLGPEVWSSIRARSMGLLGEANEDPGSFLVTGGYLLIMARRSAGPGA